MGRERVDWAPEERGCNLDGSVYLVGWLVDEVEGSGEGVMISGVMILGVVLEWESRMG